MGIIAGGSKLKGKTLDELVKEYPWIGKKGIEIIKKRVSEAIEERVGQLKLWLTDGNAIYSPDYDKVRAKLEVLNDLKKELGL